MQSVVDFFIESNSDKQSLHRYGFLYDLLLARISEQKGYKKLKVLEVGVSEFGDGSLSAWGKHENIKRVVGVDIEDYREKMDEKTVFYKLDAYRKETIGHLSEIEGTNFDLIVHDASGEKGHQEFFLDHYVDLLSKHGYLVCEDIASLALINEQCKSENVYCIDGWGNRGAEVQSFNADKALYSHRERLLIKSKSVSIKAIKKHDTKPHIARLPVFKVEDYDRTSTELAIAIPLFHSELDSQYTDFDVSRFQDTHCKGAVWAGLSLICNTDLKDNGVPLYFYVEDKVFADAMPVFEEFGVPNDWIREVSLKPSEKENDYKVNRSRFGKTHMPLLDNEIDPDILVILDSDFFTCTTRGKLGLYDRLTMDLLKRQPSMTHFRIRNISYRWYVSMMLLAAGMPDILVYNGNLQELEKEAYRRLGFDKDVDEKLTEYHTVNRFYTENYMMTFPRGHVIREYAIEHIHTCYTAPYLFAAWGEFNQPLLELSTILGLPVYDWESNFIEGKQGYDCFAHVRVDRCSHRSMTKPSRMEEYFDTFLEHVSRFVLPKGD